MLLLTSIFYNLNFLCAFDFKMPVCAFDGCFNGSKRKGVHNNVKVHIHRFPKNDDMRALWLNEIKKNSKNIIKINFETGK